LADATILTSSNEGFGLSIAESIMCGTPVIVNVTGGLQDQIGQVDDNGKPIEFDLNFGTK
jgi:glycosyltransferase involved in cell wall biosynthesis